MDCAMDVGALILAGGAGKRMGGDKLFLTIGSVPLAERVIRSVSTFAGEILLSVASRQIVPARDLLSGIISLYGVRLVEDSTEGRGPLEGIASGLAFSNFEWSFVCACDMPFLSEAVVSTLWNKGDQRASIILPRMGGYFEPLHAFYSRRALSTLLNLLDRGERKITALFGEVPVSVVEEEAFAGLSGFRRSFCNINVQNDLSMIRTPD